MVKILSNKCSPAFLKGELAGDNGAIMRGTDVQREQTDFNLEVSNSKECVVPAVGKGRD